jgi:hypothetical protein
MPAITYKLGAAAAPGVAAAGPDTIKAGGNLAASLSYGDVTQAGVGTATSVCNGRVVGFGHPMTFLGRTTLTLHPADALYIQEDSLGAPFKVANLGAPAGTITDDHLTGITGSFGALPQTTGVTSTVRYLDRSREGSSNVSVPEASASTTFSQLLGNQDRVLDSILKGSEVLSWEILGHEADAAPFRLAVQDRYVSDFDIAFESSWEIADFVFALSRIKGVTIDGVTMTSDVSDDRSTWEVTRVEQLRAGSWVAVNRRHPAFATAGKVLSQTLFARGHLRATLIAAAAGIAVTAGAALLLGLRLDMTGIALGISLGCVAHLAALVWFLRRIGLWHADAALLRRVARITLASTVMGLGLMGARSLAPETGPAGLAAFCIGGLGLYAVAAALTGALTRDDVALLTKKP